MFSYNTQNDDRVEEDTVSLPHQPSFSSLPTDSDYIYQVNSKKNDRKTPIKYYYFIMYNPICLVYSFIDG